MNQTTNKLLFPIYKTYPNLAYLDSAASAQKPERVITAVKNFYETNYANVHRGIYKLSELATGKLEESRKKIAEFINSESERQIIFTSGTTESSNLVSSGLDLKKGSTILVSELEHHSNIVPWQIKAELVEGTLEFCNIDQAYTIDLSELESKLGALQPAILAFSYVSNVLGSISDVKKIVEIKNKVSPNTLIVVDAAQATPHMKIDVQKLGIDFLHFSSHKLYGPSGVGILWGKMEHLQKLNPIKFGGNMISEVTKEKSTWAEIPNKFEGGTPNIEGIVGLAAAIDFVTEIGYEKIKANDDKLKKYAFEELNKIEKVKIFAADPEKNAGAISFTIDGIHPHDIAEILDKYEVAVRAGHHCAQILTKKLGLNSTVRASFGIYNDKNDIDKLIFGVKESIELFK